MLRILNEEHVEIVQSFEQQSSEFSFRLSVQLFKLLFDVIQIRSQIFILSLPWT